jgi:hypothetical protein
MSNLNYCSAVEGESRLIVTHCGACFLALVNMETGRTLILDDGYAIEEIVDEYEYGLCQSGVGHIHFYL